LFEVQYIGQSKSLLENQIKDILDHWTSSHASFALQTSGSTGIPKKVLFTKQQLIQSAQLTIDTFQLNEEDYFVLCLDLNTVGGFMQIIRALVLNVPLFVLETSSKPSIHLFPKCVNLAGLISLVPFQVEKMYLESPEDFAQLNNFKTILIGGVAMTEKQWDIASLIDTDVYQTYGMTETLSHIAIRKVQREAYNSPFKLIKGIEISKSSKNTLRIHHPFLGEIQTNDVVEILEEGRSFNVLGRLDNVVNSGGIKIHLEEIEKLVSASLKFENRVCAVKIEHPTFGESYNLYVESASELNIEELIRNFPKYKRPVKVVFLSQFPLLKSGKVDKIGMQNMDSK